MMIATQSLEREEARGETAAPQVSTAPPLVTAEELLRLPHDGFRYELVKGELRRMWPAGAGHGGTGMNLAGPLSQHVKARNLGVVFLAETGFRIASNPDTVRAPDIAFVRRERIPDTGLPQGYWPGAPDLAVEVVSPGDTVYEVDEKVEEWLAAGTLLVWVVNPRRRVVQIHAPDGALHLLREDDELNGCDVVPGFVLRVAEIFA